MIKLSKYEKETILRTSKGDEEYSIYIFDLALQKRLEMFAKNYPEICREMASTEEGRKTYVVDKTRVSIRLLPSVSQERRKAASEYAKKSMG